ncbi:hypothetical protein BGZ54_000354 [Gamsiella multidivaricata]|nr:hypothetical protein BGZ54_000354 [Gamsiella multidivaricata]
MLIDTDLSSLGQYLKVDRASLVTKGVASVRSPVTRLRESSFTIGHLSFCEQTRTEFLRHYAFDQWKQNLEGEPIAVDEAMIDRMEGVKTIRDDMITSKEGKIIQVDLDSMDNALGGPSLSLTALGVGMEGQRYDEKGLDLAIERIKDEAPEVFSPSGAVDKVKDVVSWLKEEL